MFGLNTVDDRDLLRKGEKSDISRNSIRRRRADSTEDQPLSILSDSSDSSLRHSARLLGDDEHAGSSRCATPKKREKSKKTMLSPQDYFCYLLTKRGYSVDTVDTLEESNYRQDVSEEQLASYGPVTQNAVRKSDVETMTETLACGLLPNACNQYGESLLHMCCRRGNKQMLDAMVNHGVVLQIIDDYGRTPLHDAFWAPSPAFDVVESLIKEDRGMLFMTDRRGFSPLEYAHLEDWEEWKEWLDRNIEDFFPYVKDNKTSTKTFTTTSSPTKTRQEYDRNEISAELMRMVAHGQMSPSEALLLSADDEDEEWDEDDEDDNSTHFGTECAYLAESTIGSFSSGRSFSSSELFLAAAISNMMATMMTKTAMMTAATVL